ncbi:hypothetical protein GCM10009721_25760 [Terrabacter tumescens]|uniref:Uncharacterized protein n=1 Tax=Terrabacter tumescens TaxID=60443 RepID=A0ABQ2I1F4_9MICO|nr:hypothetical protein [Terrabacter tumescens]GGM97684.1 hypothetical protein GCM10009721_25760 [Terrabacter tumescens]
MHAISRTAAFLAGAVIGVSALATTSSASADSGGVPRRDVLRAPLQGSQLSDPPLFGLVRGGAPWVISEGTARLRADGDLQVEVEGLIIPTRGDNPLATLSATVVCNGKDVMMTAPVPFSAAGDARIETRVSLPTRCLAPVVLLNPLSNAGAYIAATGR